MMDDKILDRSNRDNKRITDRGDGLMSRSPIFDRTNDYNKIMDFFHGQGLIPE